MNRKINQIFHFYLLKNTKKHFHLEFSIDIMKSLVANVSFFFLSKCKYCTGYTQKEIIVFSLLYVESQSTITTVKISLYTIRTRRKKKKWVLMFLFFFLLLFFALVLLSVKVYSVCVPFLAYVHEYNASIRVHSS